MGFSAPKPIFLKGPKRSTEETAPVKAKSFKNLLRVTSFRSRSSKSQDIVVLLSKNVFKRLLPIEH
jgi:hypothetical protein